MAWSTIGIIDATSGCAVVLLGVLFGLFFIYKWKSKEAKLLLPLGLVSIFAGLLYLGVLVDTISLLTTGKNFPYENAEVALVSYIFFAPVMIVAVYLATAFEYKNLIKYTVPIFIVLGIIFTIIIFTDPKGSFNIDFYENNNPRLVDYNIELTSRAGRYLLLMLIPVIIVFTIGLIYNAKRTTGIIRKRFVTLSLGAICYGIFGALEGFTVPGVMVILVRIGYLSSFWLMYLGIKPME